MPVLTRTAIRRLAALPLGALAAWFQPAAALACAACGFGEDESRQAYIGTTIFMSVTPVLVILGFVFFVARRIKKHDDAQPRPGERAPAPPSPIRR